MTAEGNTLLVRLDILKVLDGLGELQTGDGSRGFAGEERRASADGRDGRPGGDSGGTSVPGVLEVNTEVRPLAHSNELLVREELSVGVASLESDDGA